MSEDMTRLELMTLLLSLEALLEDDKSDKALEVIKRFWQKLREHNQNRKTAEGQRACHQSPICYKKYNRYQNGKSIKGM